MVKTLVLAIILSVAALLAAGCRGLAESPTPATTSTTPVTPVTPPPPPPPPPAPNDITAINHIVFLYQENRSFDNYFSNLNVYRAAHGLPTDVDVESPTDSNPTFDGTGTISVFKMNTVCAENTSPAWNESHVQINRDYQFKPANQVTGTPMNGFVYTAAKYARDQTNPAYFDTDGKRTMGYYTEQEIPFYYFLATQFATSDRWFSPVPANSPANHFYALAATSHGIVYDATTPFSNKVIFQLLEEAGVRWKIYSPQYPGSTINYWQPFASQHQANILPLSQFAIDANAGQLPAVSFIDEADKQAADEHPGDNIQTGAAYVAGLVNTLIASPSWKDSVMFISWDEAGGLYDHVGPVSTVSPDGIPPQDTASTDIVGDFNITGLRVPILVVSPFTKPGFVSHTARDHTAILKFIETRFKLPNLTNRDMAQPDMLEFFDFAGVPNLKPPAAPAQPTNGPCYYDHLP